MLVMHEVKRLRELRDADKRSLSLLKDTKDRLKAEYDQRLFQLNETESRLLEAIDTWGRLINMAKFPEGF